MGNHWESSFIDAEKNILGYARLTNASIRSFGWEGVTVTVKDRTTKKPKTILGGIDGIVKAGSQFQALRLLLWPDIH